MRLKGGATMKQKLPPLVLVIIALAFFGLFYQLYKDPLGLLRQVLIIGLVVATFYLIYRYLTRHKIKRRFSHPSRGIQSFQKKSPKNKNTQNLFAINKEKNAPYRRKGSREYSFKVIDGNKGKKQSK